MSVGLKILISVRQKNVGFGPTDMSNLTLNEFV